jgi:pimeloyl-ACP methyl ester carboxylesterase
MWAAALQRTVNSNSHSYRQGVSQVPSTTSSDTAPLTVVLVHGAFADASGWNGVIDRLLGSIPGPVLAVGHSYGGAVITNAASQAGNVVGLVYVAAFAPNEGERLIDAESASKDSVLNSALVPLQYPVGQGQETAVEFVIDSAKFRDAFAADLPAEQTAEMAATQRPVAELAFSEPSGMPAWKNLPSWTVVATGDTAAGADIIRSMAERAGATITEVKGSHVIMMSQPQAVTDVILTAVAAVS